jgi:protein-L-isoaspartate(D-aspartate) O-methyltransferase
VGSDLRFEKERQKMLEEQLIPRGINDQRVLNVMGKVPRHKFIEEALQDQAYGDHPLPIGYGQTISQPFMVALMTQCLKLEGWENVLEIGTGSGYQAAILSYLAEKVYSIEKIWELSQRAQKTLDELKIKNVLILSRDGTLGLPEYAPFDRIIITAGAPDIPKPLMEQLADGGIMVIPKGDQFCQTLYVVEKHGRDVTEQAINTCVFVPLIGKYGWKE